MTFSNKPFRLPLLLAAICMSFATTAVAEDDAKAFTAQAVDGRDVDVAATDDVKATVVCFLGTECPLAKLYGPRLQALSEKFSDVRFIGVNANKQDSPAEIRAYVKQHGVSFPLIKDSGARIADLFQAQRTPEVFVLNNKLKVCYRGRIDDQYEPGIAKKSASQNFVADALKEILNGREVTYPRTEAVGCLIGRAPQQTKTKPARTDVTFAKDVAAVLNRHCVECHRPGEIGPFSLTEYDEVVGWADTLLEVIDDGRMPPWHATDNHIEIANARSMPDDDIQILRDWVALGAPLGDKAKLPPVPEFREGWQLSKEPDQIVAMRKKPFRVPAEGTVEYQYFVVDPGFTEDKWIREAQIIPGNRSVVHHAITFIRPPDGAPIGRDGNIGWLMAYVPGQRIDPLPDGHARFVPAKSKLVFQMHYTPTGTARDDLTKLGLVFADESEVTHEVFTIAGINQDFEIPPHANRHTVHARVRFPRNGKLLSVSPHMHFRGHSFVLNGRTAHEEKSRILVDVPRYDFNWQHIYWFAKPFELSQLQEMNFTATFDNSSGNPVNPDPTEHVCWGDQTWEEMAVAFFEVSQPRPGVASPEKSRSANSKRMAKDSQKEDERHKRINEFVTKFLRDLDSDGDGRVQREEVPLVVRRFGTFNRYDKNRDDLITEEEIRTVAKRVVR